MFKKKLKFEKKKQEKFVKITQLNGKESIKLSCICFVISMVFDTAQTKLNIFR